jgi:hypothetical protein
MHLIALAVVWGLATPVWAGELDREFKAGDVKAPATAPRSSPKTVIELVSGSELDQESPTQAWRRGGWGGHYGGWGGHYGGWGGRYGGWGHGWGYGHVGYHRSYYGGFYGGWGYGASYAYPYSYYSPVYAYSYYPSWGYAAYGYPGWGYAWW